LAFDKTGLAKTLLERRKIDEYNCCKFSRQSMSPQKPTTVARQSFQKNSRGKSYGQYPDLNEIDQKILEMARG
jgi:hypothetical protein